MKFTVEMLAFGEPGETQVVEVPDADLTGDTLYQLETIFQCGQDVPGRNSVSAGDVIRFGGASYLVTGVGFKHLSQAEYLDYLEMPVVERLMYALTTYPSRRQRF